ncbi:MAG: class I SAM-dependent methyltransferase [Syntrophaceae bacterium]
MYKKIVRRISAEGLTDFLYIVAGRIDYPLNGFPRYGVDEFMKIVSKQVKSGDVVLDAGAGHCPYKELFSHACYQSCDYMPVLEEIGGNTKIAHTFFCDLEEIPREPFTYDAVVCNQVLEHVKHPEKVIAEFYRILKPGGKLFLTAPQCAGIHMAPYHFFNFTQYGLNLLFENNGFRVLSIQSIGGIFAILGKVMQMSYSVFLRKIPGALKLPYFPIHVLVRLIMCFVSFILFHLDNLDTEKGWTLNYGCYCLKPDKS